MIQYSCQILYHLFGDIAGSCWRRGRFLYVRYLITVKHSHC
nr:MAG TPA: hypothetical protein [Caudoviricetes sp.]